MLLGIDQGTTGSTAVLLTGAGRRLASFTSAVPQHFPYPGWVEHDPEEIWKSVGLAVKGVLKISGANPKKIRAIGITNQRETVSLFQKEQPLHRFIVWQDRRTTEMCEKLKGSEKFVRSHSGLPIDPYFSATKIRWIAEKLKLKKNSDVKFRTVESFLLNRLTGADVTEATNASRTSLLNLQHVSWDDDLFEFFRIPKHWAPTLIASEGFSFRTKRVGFLPDGIPICAALGDQQAALFGQLGWNSGTGKITYGTGSFVLLNVGEKPVISKNALVSTVALKWSSGRTAYALEGSAFICGAWVQWLRDQLGMIESADESEELARRAENSGEVYVVPALSGMGAPFWKPRIRGAIVGISRGSAKPEIALASLEALCFQNKALVDAMLKDFPKVKPSWRVDGGAVKNNLLLQIQANVFNSNIIRPQNLEATASGVAQLAGLSAHLLSESDIQKNWKKDREFFPKKDGQHSMLEKYRRWYDYVLKLAS
jgi:glycerol kinase